MTEARIGSATIVVERPAVVASDPAHDTIFQAKAALRGAVSVRNSSIAHRADVAARTILLQAGRRGVGSRRSSARTRTEPRRRRRAEGKEMLKRPRLSLVAVTVLMLALAAPASANSSVVTDPQGDIAVTESAYLDIIAAKITEQVGSETLYLKIENAQAIPDAPAGFRAWNWFIHTTSGVTAEYVLTVRYCTSPVAACATAPRWESIVLDNTGPTPKVTFNAFPFRVDGAVVKAFVEPSQIGGATTFSWVAASRSVPATPTSPVADVAASASFSR